MISKQPYDAVVIGGGFYGTAIATYLASSRGFKSIMIIERESELLMRASYNNQARVHNGYHYPRSFTTAFRSRVNLPKFVRDYPKAVKQDFTKLYAIARRNSKVTAKQFERFCHAIGAEIEVAPEALGKLFEPRLIEKVFLVKEYAFDSSILKDFALKELYFSGVEIKFNTCVKKIYRKQDNLLGLEYESIIGKLEEVSTRFVFNCTYDALAKSHHAFI